MTDKKKKKDVLPVLAAEIKEFKLTSLLTPVMMIGDEVYGRLTPDQVPEILAKY